MSLSTPMRMLPDWAHPGAESASTRAKAMRMARGIMGSSRNCHSSPEQAGLVEVHGQDRQLEEGRARVFLIEEQHADIFLGDIDLRRVALLAPRHDADFL